MPSRRSEDCRGMRRRSLIETMVPSTANRVRPQHTQWTLLPGASMGSVGNGTLAHKEKRGPVSPERDKAALMWGLLRYVCNLQVKALWGRTPESRALLFTRASRAFVYLTNTRRGGHLPRVGRFLGGLGWDFRMGAATRRSALSKAATLSSVPISRAFSMKRSDCGFLVTEFRKSCPAVGEGVCG